METAREPAVGGIQNVQRLVEFAKSLLGTPFSYKEFNCWHFVRKVYEKFNIPMQVGKQIEEIADFSDPLAIGKLILLKRRNDKSSRRYTHVAIYIGDNRVIHNTFYLGKRVVINTMEEIMIVYQIV